jgi:hypothetical protein
LAMLCRVKQPQVRGPDFGRNTHCFRNARSGQNLARTCRKELRLFLGQSVDIA